MNPVRRRTRNQKPADLFAQLCRSGHQPRRQGPSAEYLRANGLQLFTPPPPRSQSPHRVGYDELLQRPTTPSTRRHRLIARLQCRPGGTHEGRKESAAQNSVRCPICPSRHRRHRPAPHWGTTMLEEFVTPHEAKNIGELLQDIKSHHGSAAIGLGRAGLRECGETD